MKNQEAAMASFCSKCNSEMEERKTNIIVSKGMFSQKRVEATVCEECGSVEFFLE